MTYFLVLLASYLAGSIPFGLIFGKLCGRVDVREHGSGNIGMSNVLRTTGYLAALLTFLGDCGKGVGAVLLARLVSASPAFWLLAGIVVVAGHNWTVFLKFKGGKGIATMAGVVLGIQPAAFLIVVVVWLLVLFISRYISLASLVVACVFPLLQLFFGASGLELALSLVLTAFAFFTHRGNIRRLQQGTEFRFGQKSL